MFSYCDVIVLVKVIWSLIKESSLAFNEIKCYAKGTVSSVDKRFTLSVFQLRISVAETVDIKVSRIGPIAPPIHDTNISAVAATGIDKKHA